MPSRAEVAAIYVQMGTRINQQQLTQETLQDLKEHGLAALGMLPPMQGV